MSAGGLNFKGQLSEHTEFNWNGKSIGEQTNYIPITVCKTCVHTLVLEAPPPGNFYTIWIYPLLAIRKNTSLGHFGTLQFSEPEVAAW